MDNGTLRVDCVRSVALLAPQQARRPQRVKALLFIPQPLDLARDASPRAPRPG
jgi:hypothetical protein